MYVPPHANRKSPLAEAISAPGRFILVRMVDVPVGSVDCADPGHCVRVYGDLLGVPGRFQLPGRYVSPVCEFGYCRAVLL